MTNYVTFLANTYSMTNAPLVVEMGYENQKSVDYNCWTKLLPTDILVTNVDDSITVTDNVVQVVTPGSYALLVYDKTAITPQPVLFSVYAFNNLFINNQVNLLAIFNQELPAIYDNSDPLNHADNFGTVGVLASVYRYLYILFYDSISSIGEGKEYNTKWELVFVGVNNFLSGAAYPADLLNTLMQINTKTGTTVRDISICLTKVLFQYLGQITPVSIVYDSGGNIWHITLYPSEYETWALGIEDSSELGETTYLGGGASTNFLWFMYILAERLMPCFAKFDLNFSNFTTFETLYDTSIVDAQDYIHPNLIYDAYATVNNDNNFNTKGYLEV